MVGTVTKSKMPAGERYNPLIPIRTLYGRRPVISLLGHIDQSYADDDQTDTDKQ